MKRLSVMVTSGSHRLYDNPNGDLCRYEDAQKEIEAIKRVNGSLVRDLYKQIENLSGMVESAIRVCD